MNLPGFDNTLAENLAAADSAALSLGVRGLTCARNDRLLFQDLEFTAAAGQIVQIEGANGSGKTTLLKALCGFIQPESGAVLWRGTDIRSAMDDYLAELCYIGHHNGIKPGLTCLENMRFAAALAAAAGTVDYADILARYGLGDYEDTPAQLLSSGQRRRLALARLSVGRARIWILDEPYTSLDEAGKVYMKTVFRQHVASGGVIIMTSHEERAWEDMNVAIIRLS